MANQPRYAIIDDHSTFHVTWQCHNKDFLLESDWAKQTYYDLLLKYSPRYRVRFFSYCFMSSHPHLTGFCENKNLFSDFFRIVNSMFAKLYNKKHGRKGQVVMDRFKSPCIQTDKDLLKVIFYNDLNPKRAHMVHHPKQFEWSSFHYYAYGKKNPLLSPAPCYLNLGNTPEQRQKAYLAMVEEILENDWKEKRPYSSVPFIGNPLWVQAKLAELKTLKKENLQKWKKNYLQKFPTDPPKQNLQ